MKMEIGQDTFVLTGPEYRRLLAADEKLKFLIEEIIDRGREGMTDGDWAEQVIAMARNIRAAFQSNAAGAARLPTRTTT